MVIVEREGDRVLRVTGNNSEEVNPVTTGWEKVRILGGISSSRGQAGKLPSVRMRQVPQFISYRKVINFGGSVKKRISLARLFFCM